MVGKGNMSLHKMTSLNLWYPKFPAIVKLIAFTLANCLSNLRCFVFYCEIRIGCPDNFIVQHKSFSSKQIKFGKQTVDNNVCRVNNVSRNVCFRKNQNYLIIQLGNRKFLIFCNCKYLLNCVIITEFIFMITFLIFSNFPNMDFSFLFYYFFYFLCKFFSFFHFYPQDKEDTKCCSCQFAEYFPGSPKFSGDTK